METIPDIASTISKVTSPLRKVGMQNIEVPIQLDLDGFGRFLQMAKADAFVSLDASTSKGIHMSRLFLALQNRLGKTPLCPTLIEDTLRDFLDSHKDLSQSAYLNLSYELPMIRPALKSNNSGVRGYPIRITSSIEKSTFKLNLEFSILYSSTCPCSAALARQLIQKNFSSTFSEEKILDRQAILDWLGSEHGILATPHGQRSEAKICITPKNPSELSLGLEKWISLAELAVATPVQTAVKREDEQEFARLNGSNLMFAEDAARRLKQAFIEYENIHDFSIEVVHFESLHPHNAIAVATKND